MNGNRSARGGYSWVFRSIFLRSLIAGVIGGILYTFLLTAQSVMNVGLDYPGVDRILYAQLIWSIFGAVFGLIFGCGFGYLDGIALSLLMSIGRFTPQSNRLHLNLLSLSSAAITGISAVLILAPFDSDRSQAITTNLALLAMIAAIGAWWGARQTLKSAPESHSQPQMGM